MELITIPLLVLLTAVIEWQRIKAVHGKVVNINKRYTDWIAFAAGAVAYFMCKPLPVENVALLFAGFRAFFYSPVLNVLRGKGMFYVSETTNSIIDQNISFWLVRVIGVILIGIGFEL